jgi:hypothetical protein
LQLLLRERWAAPGDAVLLEPLGYIGYFSGLKKMFLLPPRLQQINRGRNSITKVALSSFLR